MDKRPAGIFILSFIYILIGAVGIYSTFSMGAIKPFALGTSLFLGIAGIGLIFAKQWAWWIIGVMTLFSFSSNVIKLLVVFNQVGILAEAQKIYLKLGGKAFIQGLIILFLFSEPVINFFAIKSIKKSKLFIILTVATAGLYAVLYLF